MQDYLATTTLGDLARKGASAAFATTASEAAGKESVIRQNIGEMNQ
jgi:hypothetical protein